MTLADKIRKYLHNLSPALSNSVAARLLRECELRLAEIEDLKRLAEPCKCEERIVGMCIPCAMRDQFAGGDSAVDISKDFPEPPA